MEQSLSEPVRAEDTDNEIDISPELLHDLSLAGNEEGATPGEVTDASFSISPDSIIEPVDPGTQSVPDQAQFQKATHGLLMADSPTERVEAARNLGRLAS